MPESKFIDLLPLKAEVEGNISVCKMLISAFIKDIDEYIHTMSCELNDSNLPKLYFVAHKIIPSIRIFSIAKLEPIIIQLETNLKNQENLECIRKDIATSLDIFEQVKIELQNELKTIAHATK